MEKDSKKSSALSSRSDTCMDKCPVLKVLRTNEFGMVVESNRSFDIGEEMTLGFHLSDSGDGNSFISAESLVVQSERTLSSHGESRHRITLLFSDIDDADRDQLIEMSKHSVKATRPRTMGMN